MTLAAALVVGVDRAAAWLTTSDENVDLAQHLFVQPRSGNIYLLGNSMFKTGVDPELLHAQLDGPGVDFEYHNGHYTNLWYLIAQTALGKTAQDPDLVVWGFRPAYARLPAFRQNRLNDTDTFAFDDPLFGALSAGASFSSPSTWSSANVRDNLDNKSGLYGARESVKQDLNDSSIDVGVAVLEGAGVDFATNLRESIVEGDRTLADEIIRLVTGGEIVLTEELVVDGQGDDFIEGPERSFDEGFIPATAKALESKGIDQVVVIWKPVHVASGDPIPAEDQFVQDALEFFSQTGVPVLDLYHEPRVTLEHFASGDHYNEAGRVLVTKLLADFLHALPRQQE